METNRELSLHSWLDGGAIRTVSDTVLGGILLVMGTVAIWDAGGRVFCSLIGWEFRFFSPVVSGLLCVVGITLLVRGAFLGSPHAAPPSLRVFLIVAAVVSVSTLDLYLAEWLGRVPELVRLIRPVVLLFGARDFVTIIALALAVAIALSRASRARAAGMVLLGLFLAAVGLDPIESEERLTMGLEALVDGIDRTALHFGLFVVADGTICLVSPPLLLATYARQVRGRHNSWVPALAVHSMRIGGKQDPNFCYSGNSL